MTFLLQTYRKRLPLFYIFPYICNFVNIRTFMCNIILILRIYWFCFFNFFKVYVNNCVLILRNLLDSSPIQLSFSAASSGVVLLALSNTAVWRKRGRGDGSLRLSVGHFNKCSTTYESHSVGWKLYLIIYLFTEFSPLWWCLQMCIR